MKLSTSPSLTALLLAIALAACTKPNPAVCCLDAADCDEVGIPEVRGCSQGLACVDHQCTVPSCAEAGCGADAPVCNVVTDVCDPCADTAECERFADTPVCGGAGSCVQCLGTADCAGRAVTPVCDASSQSCVECLQSDDCSAINPICDVAEHSCRKPIADNECPSGALGDDGACVPEMEVVYLSPAGSDVGTCARTAPCLTVYYAVSHTTGLRNHLVFAPGQYNTIERTYNSSLTPAAALIFHGHGAEVIGPTSGDGCMMRLDLSVTMRDLKLTGRNTGWALCLYTGPHLLERVDVSASIGLGVSSPTTVRDYRQVAGFTAIAVYAGGALVLDRAVIGNVGQAIDGRMGGTLQVSNTLIYDTTIRSVNLEAGCSGSIQFTTIANSTPDSNIGGARNVACGSANAVTVRSSIMWSPNAGSQPPISGCNVQNSIAGPNLVAGTINSDPLFVNAGQDDYHLGPGSPARDVVDTGPTVDFEGSPRPQGTRYDIGADEAMP